MFGKISVLRQSPWLEVILYLYGMLSLSLGVASLIAAIDPRPFPISSWWYFVIIGLFLAISGSISLALIRNVQDYPQSLFIARPSIHDTTCNSTILLNETVGYNDSPIVELRDVSSITNDSAFVGSQNTVTSSVPSISSSIFYYKETYV